MNIADYWIEQIKQTKEFQALASAESPELDLLSDALKEALDDQFIQRAHDRGLARRERMLKIIPFADDTLETRRFRVQAMWNSKLPYTYPVLLEKLDQLCGANGYAIILDHDQYSLEVKLELTVKRMFSDVQQVLTKMAPANLTLTVFLHYRQHDELHAYTHEQLNAYTHQHLREEAL